MSYRDALAQWEHTVSRQMPHLSRPQALVLALWSYAMIVCKQCGTTSGAAWLAELLGGSYHSWRQRLREWCYNAQDKKGQQRSEVVVVSCFAALLRWMPARCPIALRCWQSVWCIGDVPLRWHGPSYQAVKRGRGNRIGWRCWSVWPRPCLLTGW